MALTLSYGNKPPARAFFRLGSKIRKTELQKLVLMQHEHWANSGEHFGGHVWKSLPQPLTTASTTFNYGLGNYNLANICPFMEIDIRSSNTDRTNITWACFGSNFEMQVEFLDSTYTVVTTSTSAVTNGIPQWVSASRTVTGLVSDNIIGLRVQFRMLGFDTVAVVRHFAAIARPTAVGQIPT